MLSDPASVVGYYDEWGSYVRFPAWDWSELAGTVDLSSFVNLKYYSFYGCYVTAFTWPATAPTTCEAVSLQRCPLASDDDLDFQDWTALISADLGDMVDGGRINLDGCAAFRQLGLYADADFVEGVDGLDTTACDNLWSYTTGGGFSSAEIDNILVDLDASGVTFGYCSLEGDNAAPGAAGQAAKTSLEGKGWTVSTN